MVREITTFCIDGRVGRTGRDERGAGRRRDLSRRAVTNERRVRGGEAGGAATLTASGDTRTIRVEATGVPPSMMHLQHLHGFTEDGAVSSYPSAEADSNGDGVVDLVLADADSVERRGSIRCPAAWCGRWPRASSRSRFASALAA